MPSRLSFLPRTGENAWKTRGLRIICGPRPKGNLVGGSAVSGDVLEIMVGTRGSELARRQTRSVIQALCARNGSVHAGVRVVRSAGDRDPARPLDDGTRPGLFTRELGQALLDGRIDLAVHSLKDLPTARMTGLVIAAVPERASPLDCLVTRDGGDLDALGRGARVGTSSPRRRAQVLARRPDLEVAPLRGNMETRLAKLARGEYDAIVTARAALDRLGKDCAAVDLPSADFLPAPGQGALAVEARESDAAVLAAVATIDDDQARGCVTAERAFLDRLGGGCALPVGALARRTGEGALLLDAAVYAPDGSRVLRGARQGPVDDADALGRDLAEEMIERGARQPCR